VVEHLPSKCEALNSNLSTAHHTQTSRILKYLEICKFGEKYEQKLDVKSPVEIDRKSERLG
jgi:hypothetical protein